MDDLDVLEQRDVRSKEEGSVGLAKLYSMSGGNVKKADVLTNATFGAMISNVARSNGGEQLMGSNATLLAQTEYASEVERVRSGACRA